MPDKKRRDFIWGAVLLSAVETVVVARRRGHIFDPRTIVRCRSGHLFTTVWLPGASVKALRLGWWRFQHCPVGRHWTLVTPVTVADLTDDERRDATARRDARIP
jgi:hypothetical protein